MAGGRGGVGVVQRHADDPQAHRQRTEQRGHAGQRQAVLPPGDPGHPPPRHWPQARSRETRSASAGWMVRMYWLASSVPGPV